MGVAVAIGIDFVYYEYTSLGGRVRFIMKKARNVFWIVFALSILWIVIGGSIYRQSAEPTQEPEATYCPDCPEPEPALPASGYSTDILAIITSITSLLGAVITTIGAYRKDKLESKKSELEARKTELDLEERRLELEKKKLDAEIEIARKRRELKELQNKDK